MMRILRPTGIFFMYVLLLCGFADVKLRFGPRRPRLRMDLGFIITRGLLQDRSHPLTFFLFFSFYEFDYIKWQSQILKQGFVFPIMSGSLHSTNKIQHSLIVKRFLKNFTRIR